MKQHAYDRQKEQGQDRSSPTNDSSSNNSEITLLKHLIDMKFNKFSGVGDAKDWLLQTMNQFKQCRLRRIEQFQSIPFLLIDGAYLWYVGHIDLIIL